MKKSTLQLMLSYSIRFIVVAESGVAVAYGQWFNLFLACLTLLVIFLPALIERSWKIALPFSWEFPVILFLFASLVLGDIRGFYTTFWWWDLLLHGSSGVLLGYIGFLLVYILHIQHRFAVKINPELVGIFAFTFALALGVLWEIAEFFADQLLGSTTQEGNFDTMSDLIMDTGGALVTSILGYVRLKTRPKHFVRNLMRHFRELNEKWKQKSIRRRTKEQTIFHSKNNEDAEVEPCLLDETKK